MHHQPVKPTLDKVTHIHEVLNGTLSGGGMLSGKATEGHHGKATVLDFILLVGLVHGALGHSERVKVAAAC